MEFVASYALLVQNKQETTKANISKLITAVGGTVDAELLNSFMSKIEGKSYEDIVSTGSAMMTLQSAAAPVASGAAKVEEKVEESEESSDDAEIAFF